MIINFGDLTIQEAQVILAALKKLPMEVVEVLHNRLLNTANEQFLAQQPQVNPDDITIVKKAEEQEAA
ncbi:hypothetical protein UFOVP41_11 [uncultured Caudovirales phage]|uniref:Uncharacterized protein n=1 Tax=uncultured Caudovirales phage TaxID=2100421 RepID=A0A6J5KT84_9CAUD|nr:hypothetical protein UFOVP41_11 [uncultured Caudovirales phage]